MNENWGQKLKEIRKKHKYTQDYVVEKLSNIITKQTLIQYEKGLIAPKIDVFCALCELYEIEPNTVLLSKNEIHNSKMSADIFSIVYLIIQGKLRLNEKTESLYFENEKFYKCLKYCAWFASNRNMNDVDNFDKLIKMIRNYDLEQ